MAPVAERIELASAAPKVSISKNTIVNLKILSFTTPSAWATFKQAKEQRPVLEKEGILLKSCLKRIKIVY